VLKERVIRIGSMNDIDLDGLDDLIANKRAAGMPKHMIDTAELKRMLSRLQR